MPKPVIEPVVGSLDGVNTFFSTSASYTPGTVLVFLNGQLLKREVITELGGQSFQVDEAPEADDVLYVRYVSVV